MEAVELICILQMKQKTNETTIKTLIQPGVVVLVYDSSTWETEAKVTEIQIHSQLEYI